MTTLRVSEHFYSIQGEGPSVGTPAVFLRMQGCNLDCGHLGGTWRCDTEAVWKKGTPQPIPTFFDSFMAQYHAAFDAGAHLIITGGEPLLQQGALIEWLSLFNDLPFIEVETNGTICPKNPLQHMVSQWNVSLKLSNSGEKKTKRITQDAIDWFANTNNAIYKFVVFDPHDIDDIFATFGWVNDVPITRRFLMPAADSKAAVESLYPTVIEWCKNRGFCLGQRFHLSVWNQTTGV